jgi:hypothetical protein
VSALCSAMPKTTSPANTKPKTRLNRRFNHILWDRYYWRFSVAYPETVNREPRYAPNHLGPGR